LEQLIIFVLYMNVEFIFTMVLLAPFIAII